MAKRLSKKERGVWEERVRKSTQAIRDQSNKFLYGPINPDPPVFGGRVYTSDPRGFIDRANARIEAGSALDYSLDDLEAAMADIASMEK